MAEKLYDRADKNEYDKQDCIDLANRVEEFILRFLDPMKYNEDLRQVFAKGDQTEEIVDTAIKLKQKKVTVDYQFYFLQQNLEEQREGRNSIQLCIFRAIQLSLSVSVSGCGIAH